MSEARKTWLNKISKSLSERDRRLLDRASQTLEGNIPESTEDKPLPWAPMRGICPSPGHYNGVWNWDSAFHAMTVARWDQELAHEQVKIILDRQQPSGLLPDVIFADGSLVTNFGKPPVFPWACVRLDEHRGPADMDFLRYCYAHFKPYEAFWRQYRGGDAEGLFHYDSAAADSDKRREEARLESGWDDSVRWDVGSCSLWSIDLNCFMVMLYQAIEEMAHLQCLDDQNEWFDRAQELSTQINERMWDDELGAYCDIYRESGKSTGILSPASFMPLFINIASHDQAERMAKIAADHNKFFPGMPTVSYDNPSYNGELFWRGPTWLNTAWFACKGLKNYGYDELAGTIRETILNWCDNNADDIYEYYESSTGKGIGAPHYGWSAAFVIEFILDWELPRLYKAGNI